MKNHESRPGTMKNQPRTMKKHENPPRTMKNHKELDLRPLGKVIIFRDRQTDRQNLPIIYRCSLSGHAHCSRSMGEEAHLLNSHSKFTISFYFSTWEVTKSSLIFNVCSFQIYCFGTCITFLIIIGDQVVIFLKNHAIDISIIYGSLTAPLRA